MIENRYLLKISANYSGSLKEMWEWLEKNLDFQLKRKVGFEKVSYVVNRNENAIIFTGRTVSGTMFVNENVLEISLMLPLLYRSLAPRIKKAILSIFKER